jgi:hypothetical protein
MTLKEQLFQAIESTPDPILEQVFNFLRFLKTNELPVNVTSHSPEAQSNQKPEFLPNQPPQALNDEERLARLNQLFGAWKDQPDLEANFAAIDRERHAYRGRPIDPLEN